MGDVDDHPDLLHRLDHLFAKRREPTARIAVVHSVRQVVPMIPHQTHRSYAQAVERKEGVEAPADHLAAFDRKQLPKPSDRPVDIALRPHDAEGAFNASSRCGLDPA